MADEKLPQKFGRYEVTGVIGAGGMGVVFAARDPQLGRAVAVKAMPPRLKAAPTVAERFHREALALARLSHPNIVRVFDYGEEHNTLYYVMELLQGHSLDRRTRSKEGERLDPPLFDSKEFVDTFRPLADALAVVHAAGIVHRDIKPANIIAGVPERGAVLTDFGLTYTETDEKLTQEGTIMGTGHYMAPEQVLGKPPDALCDIYSFGAAMYEWATGRIPFENIPGPSLLAARMVAELMPVHEARPEVPESIAAVIDNCVKLKPEERFQSAKDLSRAMSRIGRSLGGVAAAETGSASGTRRATTASLPRTTQSTQSIPTVQPAGGAGLKTAVAVLLLAAGAGIAVGLWNGRSEPPPAAPAVSAKPAAAPAKSEPPRDEFPMPVTQRVESWSKPAELTKAGEIGRRTALAVAADGSLLAAWTRDDGFIELRLGRERGRVWHTPPASGKLRVHPSSEISMVARAGAYRLLYVAPDSGGKLLALVATVDEALKAWARPVALGPAMNPGCQLALVAGPMVSKDDPLLAVWEGPKGQSPVMSWGTATGQSWTPPVTAQGGPRSIQRLSALIGLGGRGLIVWTDLDKDEDSTMLAIRSEGPGQPWSAPSPLQFERGGFNVRGPALSASGERIYLMWSENQAVGHPLIVGVSLDGGQTFHREGKSVFFHSKDTRAGMVASGRRIWCTWYAGVDDAIYARTSYDGGRTWKKEAIVEKTTKSHAIPALVTGPSGDAWFLWASEAGRVKIARLP